MKVELWRGKLSAHPLFFPLFLWMCFSAGRVQSLAFLLTLLLHELAHIWLAKAFGLEVQELELLPFGCAAKTPGIAFCSNYAELLVAAAGPTVNLLAAAVTLLIGTERAEFAYAFCQSNVAMAAINLLPVLPMDGGRIFCAATALAVGERRAVWLTAVMGMLTACGVIGISVWLALQGQGNVSMFCMGLFMLGVSWRWYRMPLGNGAAHILERTRHIGRTGTAEVRMIALYQGKTLGSALTQLHQRAYNVVCVLDEQARIVAMLDEATIAARAVQYGTAARLADLRLAVDGAAVDHIQQKCYNEKQCILHEKKE